MDYIWRETRSRLVQFIETTAASISVTTTTATNNMIAICDIPETEEETESASLSVSVTGGGGACGVSSSQTREWLDFQSILVSLLRATFTSSPSRATLFTSMLATITPIPPSTSQSSNEGESVEDAEEIDLLERGGEGGIVENLSVLDVWVLLAVADTPQYKTKIHTCLIKQVGGYMELLQLL